MIRSFLVIWHAHKNERVVRGLRDRISELLLVYWVIGRKVIAIVIFSELRL
jgi:hypothetical protein